MLRVVGLQVIIPFSFTAFEPNETFGEVLSSWQKHESKSGTSPPSHRGGSTPLKLNPPDRTLLFPNVCCLFFFFSFFSQKVYRQMRTCSGWDHEVWGTKCGGENVAWVFARLLQCRSVRETAHLGRFRIVWGLWQNMPFCSIVMEWHIRGGSEMHGECLLSQLHQFVCNPRAYRVPTPPECPENFLELPLPRPENVRPPRKWKTLRMCCWSSFSAGIPPPLFPFVGLIFCAACFSWCQVVRS